MHNREHVVILRPARTGLMLHTMYYHDEVRATEEFRTDKSIAKAVEIKMANQLIDALAAPFEPEKYSDTYRTALRAMIDAKIKGEEVVAAPEAPELAPVIDIMEALKTSLAAIKKPPASEEAVEAEKPAKLRKSRKAAG
jgi:DNA end-binding protein Ku